MIYTGYALSVLGLLFLVIGLIGAGFSVFPKIRGQGAAAGGETIATILKALPDVIKELAAAPAWISSSVIGLLLIGCGQYLVAKEAAGHAPPAGQQAQSRPMA